MRAALLALAVVCAGAPAAAQNRTGNDLHELCDLKPADLCFGYITGALEGMTWAGIRFCTPTEVTFGQARDVVTRHLRQNPEVRHREAVFLVYDAIREAWPCEAEP